jgi:hypothetical protein
LKIPIGLYDTGWPIDRQVTKECEVNTAQDKEAGKGPMGNGTRFFSILVQLLLLIAVAVQGITPDANDLASTKALQLLCTLATDLEMPGDDANSVCGDVCGSLRHTVRLAYREAVDADYFAVVSSCSHTHLDDSATSGSLAIRVRSLPSDDLPRVLCRLVC